MSVKGGGGQTWAVVIASKKIWVQKSEKFAEIKLNKKEMTAKARMGKVLYLVLVNWKLHKLGTHYAQTRHKLGTN